MVEELENIVHLLLQMTTDVEMKLENSMGLKENLFGRILIITSTHDENYYTFLRKSAAYLSVLSPNTIGWRIFSWNLSKRYASDITSVLGKSPK